MNSEQQTFRIRKEQPSWLRQIFSVGITVVITAFLAIGLNQFVFQSYFVDGESMSPTLHTGDRLLVSRVERSMQMLTSGNYVPARGQIVVVNGQASPTTAERAPELIKRVIGLPGETIHIENKTITVMTSSGAFNADEKLGLSLGDTYVGEPQNIVVPEDSVFVVGDNRSRGGSFDSRSFGPVKTKFIDGRLAMRIMPFSQIRVF